jgi:hypothetical protein
MGTLSTTRYPSGLKCRRSLSDSTVKIDYVPLCPYTIDIKVGEAIRIIEADGWQLHSQKGSHRHFTHAKKKAA